MSRMPILLALLLVAPACTAPLDRDGWLPAGSAAVVEVATSERQWTGLAIARDGRTFVNFPLWSASQDFAVGELQADGTVLPYPDEEWNGWSSARSAAEHFVCVQALLADGRGRLWVLDPANPRFEGVVPGGPKLVVLDLATGRAERVYRFDAAVAPANSYLNDVRLDLERDRAYLTDSGLGALIVLDLASGRARRLLEGHASTRAEGLTLVIEGSPWLRGGSPPEVHADGIALSTDGATLYYQALSGASLWRVPTASLRDATLSGAELAAAVERVATVGPSDGLLYGADGAVYLTSLEEGAIRRVWPDDGTVETVARDPRISWPDSFARGADGRLHFTTAQIHHGASPPGPYRILRLDP